MSQNRLNCSVVFIPPEKGGRKSLPVFEHYRPTVHIPNSELVPWTDPVTGKETMLEQHIGVQFHFPGEKFEFGVERLITLDLFSPDYAKTVLVPGVEFEIREGPHVVGYGRVQGWVQ